MNIFTHLLAVIVWTVCVSGSTLLKETGVTLAGVAVATSTTALLDMLGSQISRMPAGNSFL